MLPLYFFLQHIKFTQNDLLKHITFLTFLACNTQDRKAVHECFILLHTTPRLIKLNFHCLNVFSKYYVLRIKLPFSTDTMRLTGVFGHKMHTSLFVITPWAHPVQSVSPSWTSEPLCWGSRFLSNPPHPLSSSANTSQQLRGQ